MASPFVRSIVQNQIELRADERAYLGLRPHFSDTEAEKYLKDAAPSDFQTEFLQPILAVKVVNDIGEAIAHINEFGSHHTDCILSEDRESVKKFMGLVDSAGVYHNASTRFADGFRYGFGAEVGISTNKTHSRGPVGLEGLVIYKYLIFGEGQIVDSYAKQQSHFTHSDLPPKLPF